MKKVNEIFNPNKITIKGKATIVDTESGKYVIKEKQKDIKSLYNYLSSRDFTNYPQIIDEYDNNYVYEYLKDNPSPLNQKCVDMAKLLANLHYKTSYFKPIVKDEIKGVYENILSNINYFENYYQKLIDKASNKEYPSPSNYLLLRNETKINSLISYLKKELEKWYKIVINNEKERVVYNHNNLSIDHYISNYFISWDNYQIDTPVLDLINLYKNDYNKYDYSNFLENYTKRFELLEEEKLLLFIIISLPDIKYLKEDELTNTIIIGKLINYINSSEKLIRPYYSIEQKEE